MPVDFQRQTYNFDSRKGTHRVLSASFGFPTNVIKAEAMVAGFRFQFDGDDHPLHEQFARIQEFVVAGPVVNVAVAFGLRDNSGVYDDLYSGQVDVVVIAERA